MLTLSPIKAAINEYHLKNSELKKQLVFQAEQMLADTDINQAVHNVKNLQAKWREIGYAGARQDNKLWQLFRKANDQIFANRDQNKAEEQNILLQKEQSFQQSLTNLKEQFSGELSVIQLQNLVADVNDLLSQLANNKPIIKRMVQQTEQFINEIKATITIRKGKDKQLQWHTIFTLIKQIANDQINHHDLVEHPLFEQLSSTWQKKLLEVIKTECNADRDVKTLELEILAGIESPKELSKQRMSVQVALMQEQMTAGKNINLENMFLSWLQLGKLAKNDLLQIDRIAPIFVNSNG